MKRWWKLPNVDMEIKIGKRIRYSNWDSFLRSFNPGKQIRFFPLEIKLCFADRFTRIFFRIFGGSTRTHGLNFKEYKVDFVLPFSVMDVWFILWDRKHIYQERPKFLIEQFDMTELFAKGWPIQSVENAKDIQIEVAMGCHYIRRLLGIKPEKRRWQS